MEATQSLGRRKESSARVTLKPGTGNITINGKDLKTFFPQSIYQIVVEQPFKLLEQTGKYDATVTVIGGGVKGQSEAIRLGIARAMDKINPEWHTQMKKEGWLTRDPRAVERKKPGKAKARRSFQFSKR